MALAISFFNDIIIIKIDYNKVSLMRIITGSHKKREIKAPKGLDTRPTSDRVKEGIFSTLGERVRGAQVLDLFSGSGNLAFESLSRGAEYAYLIEKDKKAYYTIMENVKRLEMTDLVKVYNISWEKYINIAKKEEKKFDLIFLDPPYYGKYYSDVIKKISLHNLLKKNGTIIIEAPKELNSEDFIEECFKVVKEAKYGDTKIFYIQKREV